MSINCVLKGTNISLSNGEKVIERLKVKESLVAYTVDGLPPVQDERLLGINRITNFSGSFSHEEVKNVWKNTKDIHLFINDRLGITMEHFIFCKRGLEYFWTRAENLEVGDELFTINNTFEPIRSIDIIEEKVDVYNIQVNKVYSYFANGYLVHNGAPCTACADCGDQGGGKGGSGSGSF